MMVDGCRAARWRAGHNEYIANCSNQLMITSPHNQRVKDAIKLRDHRGRQKQRRMIIDGTREIRRALGGRLDWVEAFVAEDLLQAEDADVAEELRSAGAEMLSVTADVFAKLAFGDRAEGIVAIARTPDRRLEDLTLSTQPTVAVLEAVEKPGNVGAVLRSADAAGIDAVVLADPHTDLFNPNTIRASQGAVFTLPIAVADGEAVRRWLRDRQFRIFAARVDGAVDYTAARLVPPAAIVLGSEASGLSEHWHDDDITAIRLPMCGTIDSLNVSVTAGVLFYEALRQRNSLG
jgi:TrmH family RNA methyltransferase